MIYRIIWIYRIYDAICKKPVYTYPALYYSLTLLYGPYCISVEICLSKLILCQIIYGSYNMPYNMGHIIWPILYCFIYVGMSVLPVRRQLDSNELQYPIFEKLNRWSWVVVGLVAFVELLTYRHRLVRHYHCSKLFLPSFRVYHSNLHVRLKNVFNNCCRRFFM